MTYVFGTHEAEYNLSKKLSWLLRHGTFDVGCPIDNEGYVKFSDIVKVPGLTYVTMEQIHKCNNKEQFSVKFDDISVQHMVKANWGHSLPVQKLGMSFVFCHA